MLTLSTILAGILAWSLAEYAIHNGYGHLARGRNHFSREHLRHHAEFGYFSPTRQKILAAIGTTALVLPIALLLLGSYYGPLFTLSFVGMYLLYEWTHYRAHVVPPTGPYSRWVRRNHFSHHFTNAKLNHGVTSPIWDWVFRTWAAPGVTGRWWA